MIYTIHSTMHGKKIKAKATRVPLQNITNTSTPPDPSPAPVLKDVLQLPAATSHTKPAKSIQGTVCLPKNLSSEEMIKFLEERRANKEMEEKKKEERRQEREEGKKQKEEEKIRKEEEKREKAKLKEKQKEERKKKREEQEQMKAERKRGRVRQEQKQAEEDNDECICPKCKLAYEEETEQSETWIECENCGRWYHLQCAGVVEDSEFYCPLCK